MRKKTLKRFSNSVNVTDLTSGGDKFSLPLNDFHIPSFHYTTGCFKQFGMYSLVMVWIDHILSLPKKMPPLSLQRMEMYKIRSAFVHEEKFFVF